MVSPIESYWLLVRAKISTITTWRSAMNISMLAMMVAIIGLLNCPAAWAQAWNQNSTTNGSVTTHTFMNPQTGQVTGGHSVQNGNTTYHSGPTHNIVSTKNGNVRTHIYTDRRTGAVTGGHSVQNGNTSYHSGPGLSGKSTTNGSVTTHNFTNPQSGSVTGGSSVQNGSSTYTNSPGYLNYPTQGNNKINNTFSISPKK